MYVKNARLSCCSCCWADILIVINVIEINLLSCFSVSCRRNWSIKIQILTHIYCWERSCCDRLSLMISWSFWTGFQILWTTHVLLILCSVLIYFDIVNWVMNLAYIATVLVDKSSELGFFALIWNFVWFDGARKEFILILLLSENDVF